MIFSKLLSIGAFCRRIHAATPVFQSRVGVFGQDNRAVLNERETRVFTGRAFSLWKKRSRFFLDFPSKSQYNRITIKTQRAQRVFGKGRTTWITNMKPTF